jgi:hypothetical protein
LALLAIAEASVGQANEVRVDVFVLLFAASRSERCSVDFNGCCWALFGHRKVSQ